ncbi:Rz-like spanin [Citrobacter phage IME-CF2]|uniref:Outer membrane lipoprotein Rz1 n=1 Tax=Citrobacter phage IME-CF2 TaxID=1673887 RepID=A0A0K0QT84_9CAUD|nr:Rz-like spanin [Citrobacter phage IME-CF2]AKR15974.1 outer membrane lipoprotein Rz1 [Citrobacter phage IME-CF2]
MKISVLVLIIGALLVGCAEKPPEKVLPTLPAKVNPVDVKWKVIAEVREIDGKKYLVMPFDGNPYVALSYPDSLIFRSWMNDVKRQKDQTDNILCAVGYTDKCKLRNLK